MKSINTWFTLRDFCNLTDPLEDRRIFLLQYLAYRDETTTQIFATKREGTIVRQPRGDNGPPLHKIISMNDDDGLTVAEIFDQGKRLDGSDTARVWHDFARWYGDKKMK